MPDGESAESLGLDGDAEISIRGLAGLSEEELIGARLEVECADATFVLAPYRSLHFDRYRARTGFGGGLSGRALIVP